MKVIVVRVWIWRSVNRLLEVKKLLMTNELAYLSPHTHKNTDLDFFSVSRPVFSEA